MISRAPSLSFGRAAMLAAACMLSAQLAPSAWAAPPDPLGFDLMLEDIPSVYSASKYDQKVTDAPASVSVITADEIAQYGWRSLEDILSSVRGIHTSNDRIIPYFGVRGFGLPGDFGSRILVMLDGQRTNDPIQDSYAIGPSIDVDLIDRVEIIRGPTSALYGTNALFAVVNIITKRGRDVSGLEVAAQGGSFGGLGGRLTVGDKLDLGLEYLVSASVYDSPGQDHYFPELADLGTHNGVATGGDGETRFNLNARLAYRQLQLQALVASRDKYFPTAPYGGLFPSNKSHAMSGRTYLALSYDDRVGSGFDVFARAFYMRATSRTLMHLDVTQGLAPEPFEIENHQNTVSDTVGAELRANLQLVPELRLTAGYELRHSPSLIQENYDELADWVDLDDSDTDMGAYVQAEWDVIDELTLNLAGRADWYETIGLVFSPRAALIARPWARTTLKSLIGTAYRAPNAFELYFDHPFGLKAAPNLREERITTLELVWEQVVSDALRTVLTGYYNNIRDLAQQTTNAEGYATYVNAGHVDGYGVEAEVAANLHGVVSGELSYAWQFVEDVDSSQPLLNSPAHLAKLRVAVPVLGEHLSVGLEAQYISPRKTHDGSYSEHVVLVNLSLLSRELVDGLRLNMAVSNLLDHDYGDPVLDTHRQRLIPQDGIRLRAGATYSFF